MKNIYQRNTYRKDLSWPHLDDEPRVQEKQQVATESTSLGVTAVFHTWAYGRFIEIQRTSGERNFIERIKAPMFVEAVLAIEIM